MIVHTAPTFVPPESVGEAERRKSDLLLAIEQMDGHLAAPRSNNAPDWEARTRNARAYRRWELRQVNQWLRENGARHYEDQIRRIIETSLPPEHPWRRVVSR